MAERRDSDERDSKTRQDLEPLLEVQIREEFGASLEETFQTDQPFRRIVATATDARDYYRSFRLPPGHETKMLEVEYGKLHLAVSSEALLKMHGWVCERSKGLTLEVQGRFVYSGVTPYQVDIPYPLPKHDPFSEQDERQEDPAQRSPLSVRWSRPK